MLFKAWFSYVRKIRNEQAFYFLPTIPDFADISVIRQRSVPDFSDYEFGGKWKARQKSKLEHKFTAFLQFRGLVMSEIHRRRTPTSLTVQNLSFHLLGMIVDHCRNLRRVGKKLSRFSRFLPAHPRRSRISTISSFSRQNLGRSGNSKISDRLGFSRDMTTRL